eukprot:TRINITY_DN11765_c0_g1_i1.p1 TRINITY_DN11765_c0_g1~~TRINITY_DN11765_c0_g1_i1.p1  ORF type:complete len:307 (+),score=80.75 TRINITY_DN11765_c0_g1_i1:60-980(+)
MGPQASQDNLNQGNDEIWAKFKNAFPMKEESNNRSNDEIKLTYDQMYNLFTEPDVLLQLFFSSDELQNKISYVIVDTNKVSSFPEKFENDIKGFCIKDVFFTWTKESLVFLYRIYPEDLLFECVLKIWRKENEFKQDLQKICSLITKYNIENTINEKSSAAFEKDIFELIKFPLNLESPSFFAVMENIKTSMNLSEENFFLETFDGNNQKVQFKSHREFDEYISQLKSKNPDAYTKRLNELRLLHTIFTFRFKEKLLFKNDRYFWSLPGDDIWEPSPYGCPLDSMNDLIQPEVVEENEEPNHVNSN